MDSRKLGLFTDIVVKDGSPLFLYGTHINIKNSHFICNRHDSLIIHVHTYMDLSISELRYLSERTFQSRIKTVE